MSFPRTWQRSVVALPSAQVPWCRCQRTASLLLPKAALEEGTSSLSAPFLLWGRC